MVMIREAFDQSLTPVQLFLVSNGEQAIEFEWRSRPGRAPAQHHPARPQPADTATASARVQANLKGDPEYLSIPISGW